MSRKQEQIKEIISLVEKMEVNTFLLPESWSETVNMQDKDISYRTYVQRRGSDRYMQFEFKGGKHDYSLNIRGDRVILDDYDFVRTVPLSRVLEDMKALYEDVKSFKSFSEGLTKLRNELARERTNLRGAKKKIEKLIEEIANYKEL